MLSNEVVSGGLLDIERSVDGSNSDASSGFTSVKSPGNPTSFKVVGVDGDWSGVGSTSTIKQIYDS